MGKNTDFCEQQIMRMLDNNNYGSSTRERIGWIFVWSGYDMTRMANTTNNRHVPFGSSFLDQQYTMNLEMPRPNWVSKIDSWNHGGNGLHFSGSHIILKNQEKIHMDKHHKKWWISRKPSVTKDCPFTKFIGQKHLFGSASKFWYLTSTSIWPIQAPLHGQTSILIISLHLVCGF